MLVFFKFMGLILWAVFTICFFIEIIGKALIGGTYLLLIVLDFIFCLFGKKPKNGFA